MEGGETLKVEALAALSDNYIWTITSAGRAIVVDPGDAEPVLAWLVAANLELSAILVTHKHADHIAGVAALVARHAPAHVIAPATEGNAHASATVGAGDRFVIEEMGFDFAVYATPGHTRGHITMVADRRVFCGDALFSCGCGRLFEGGSADLLTSMRVFRSLPEDSMICCGHEYTQSNIRFALQVEPDNANLQQRGREVAALRLAGKPTLPVSLASERQTNPFLRYDVEAVRAAAAAHAGRLLTSDADVLGVLRSWKDGM